METGVSLHKVVLLTCTILGLIKGKPEFVTDWSSWAEFLCLSNFHIHITSLRTLLNVVAS